MAVSHASPIEKSIQDPYTILSAPLMLVRSDSMTALKISVVFNDKFKPLNPIVPEPTQKEFNEKGLKYSWKVIPCVDGSVLSESNELFTPIKMIWWEAIRKEKPHPIEPSKAACVPYGEFYQFLFDLLKAKGVHENELEAFVHYWCGVFSPRQNEKVIYPYILVELIEPEEVSNYIPEVQIKSRESYKLYHFHFRFKPAFKADQGINPKDFLARYQPADLGPNAVINLGGEIDTPSGLQLTGGTGSSPDVNQVFMNEYVDLPLKP